MLMIPLQKPDFLLLQYVVVTHHKILYMDVNCRFLDLYLAPRQNHIRIEKENTCSARTPSVDCFDPAADSFYGAIAYLVKNQDDPRF